MRRDFDADIDGELCKGQFSLDVFFGFFLVARLVDEVLLDFGHQLHILKVPMLFCLLGEFLHILEDVAVHLDFGVIHPPKPFFLLGITSYCQF